MPKQLYQTHLVEQLQLLQQHQQLKPLHQLGTQTNRPPQVDHTVPVQIMPICSLTVGDWHTSNISEMYACCQHSNLAQVEGLWACPNQLTCKCPRIGMRSCSISINYYEWSLSTYKILYASQIQHLPNICSAAVCMSLTHEYIELKNVAASAWNVSRSSHFSI